MTNTEYDEKRHQLESPTPTLAIFATSAALIALSLVILQVAV